MFTIVNPIASNFYFAQDFLDVDQGGPKFSVQNFLFLFYNRWHEIEI